MGSKFLAGATIGIIVGTLGAVAASYAAASQRPTTRPRPAANPKNHAPAPAAKGTLHYVSVPPAAFRNSAGLPTILTTSQDLMYQGVGRSLSIAAPLQLPQGAKLRDVRCGLRYGGGSAYSASLRAYRMPIAGTRFERIAWGQQSFGQGTGLIKANRFEDHVIRNQEFAYHLQVSLSGVRRGSKSTDLPSNVRFRGCAVAYELPR